MLTDTEVLFSRALDYLDELKERETAEDREIFFKDILGMSDEDLEKYGITLESED